MNVKNNQKNKLVIDVGKYIPNRITTSNFQILRKNNNTLSKL